MRHWNTQQLGGQGLAADFDKYFKALSKEEKKVRGQLPHVYASINANHSTLYP